MKVNKTAVAVSMMITTVKAGLLSAIVAYGFLGIMGYPAFPLPYEEIEYSAAEKFIKKMREITGEPNPEYPTYKLNHGWKQGLGVFLLSFLILRVRPELMGKLYKADDGEKEEDT